MNSGPLLFLGLFVTMACSWLGFVLGSQLQLGGQTQTTTVAVGDAMTQTYPVPEPGDAHQGAEIYRANGCAACHTEVVRPASLGSDIARGWGARRSVAEDYLFEQPVMLGSQRIGPDLANVGTRSETNRILLHLYNPRDPRLNTKGSVMPSYRFLFDTRKKGFFPAPDALLLPPDAVPKDCEVVPRPAARALAAYLMSLRQTGYLFEAPPPPQKTNAVPNKAVPAGAGSTNAVSTNAVPPVQTPAAK